jgi:hypothetical protein
MVIPDLSPQTGPVIVHMRLCISNGLSFIQRTYGTTGHAFKFRSSSSTYANPWRHPSHHHQPPFHINPSNGNLNVRPFSWATKFNPRPSRSSNDSDPHEEAAKSAVLEAIKGRQQTDLMLRCESISLSHRPFASQLSFTPT